MEFHEKLQELRKSRGLTQEELAEALYVSRTAISKWESGRGYPSIDSLKEISKYFSVTIDDLLSGEALISIAERENKTNIQNLFDLLFGMVDMLSVLLIVLPLYPRTVDGYVYSVNLFEYL
ncbi:MAG: helix-turn-helix domain-containing protein, partial [Lachnospiraceae bacterium]|nr:helix-turn-helix domain-containing protein [Lachnospiraceae bacterium]